MYPGFIPGVWFKSICPGLCSLSNRYNKEMLITGLSLCVKIRPAVVYKLDLVGNVIWTYSSDRSRVERPLNSEAALFMETLTDEAVIYNLRRHTTQRISLSPCLHISYKYNCIISHDGTKAASQHCVTNDNCSKEFIFFFSLVVFFFSVTITQS